MKDERTDDEGSQGTKKAEGALPEGRTAVLTG